VTSAPPWITFVVTFIASNLPAGTDTVSGPETSFDSSISRPIIPLPFQCHESPLVSGFFRNCLVGWYSALLPVFTYSWRCIRTHPVGLEYQSRMGWKVETVSTR